MARPRSEAWAVAAVMLAATLPYLNAFHAGFVFDDGPVIRDNPLVTGPFDTWNILAAPLYHGNLYRPVTLLSYALNEQLTPGSAAAFHAVNIVLHVAVTALVFVLGNLFVRNRTVAFIAAALFAVHPIHTEAVTSIVGRAELLVALFGLITLCATLRSQDTKQSGWDAVALLTFTAALFSKESAVTLLPLIPLCRAARRGGSLWPALARELRSGQWLPFAAAVGLFLIARTYVVGSLTLPTRPIPLDNVLAHVPALARIRTACGVLADYAGMLVLPLVLSADYSWRQVVPAETWLEPSVIAGVGVLLVSVIGFLALAPRKPVASVIAAFPLVTLALTANLLFPIGTVKAERLLYLPSVGCALGIALLAYRTGPGWSARRGRALLAAALVVFAARTWIRNRDWFDSMTLFQSTVTAAPASSKAHYNLAVAFEKMGDIDTAALHYRESLRLWEDYEDSAFGLGLIYEKKGVAPGAIDWYRKTVTIAPGHNSANTNLCRLLLHEHDFAAAETACRHGLRFAPTDPNLLKGLGAALLGQGDHERGLGLLQRSLAHNPSDAELRALVARLEREGAPPS